VFSQPWQPEDVWTSTPRISQPGEGEEEEEEGTGEVWELKSTHPPATKVENTLL